MPCPESLMPMLCRWSRIIVGLEGEPVESLPDLGIDLLTAGFDTPAIMALAVCDPSEYPDDLRRAAWRAFASLGLPGGENRQFHLLVAIRSVATHIVDGTLPAEKGLDLVVGMWVTARYPELLSEWMILGEAIFLFREGMGGLKPHQLTEATIPETIRTLARKFLSENPLLLHPPSS
ncbi:MAG: hypothetical protein EOP86_03570 [Verrucomicrobiaceae bacterium]|nr:MAG: hypothetical protein EOP86_03570 [Verrucomicrobiaceae bacterium]